MILYLDSQNSTNNSFKLDDPVHGAYKLLSFTCTNNLYNVNDYNNKIYINENGTDFTLTLTNGYYDINDLETHLEQIFNADINGTLTVTTNTITNKFTFSNTLPFYFTFSTNTHNSARKLLGLNAVDSESSTSKISDIPIDLNTYKDIFINIKQNDDRNILSSNHFNTSFIVNGTGSFGETLRYINDDNFNQEAKFYNTKALTLRFHDINNNDIDLNSDYQIILQR